MGTPCVLTALVLGAVMLATGFPCGAPDAVAQPLKPVIRFGVNRAAQTLDPVTADANADIWASMQIYQQLVRVKGDGFEPDLAERWTTSADGRTWTFFLQGRYAEARR